MRAAQKSILCSTEDAEREGGGGLEFGGTGRESCLWKQRDKPSSGVGGEGPKPALQSLNFGRAGWVEQGGSFYLYPISHHISPGLSLSLSLRGRGYIEWRSVELLEG